ncbi:MAG TPA: hypothetical protein VGK94_14005 [Candidatus Polarisedimenticolia bacterium]|jgi:hypothetical protein
MRRNLVILLLCAVGTAGLAVRQTWPAEEESAATRIQELERRVAELEALLRKVVEADSAARTAELQRQIDLMAAELEKARLGKAAAPRELEPAFGLGPAASKVYSVERGVSIGGYGEALVQDFSAKADDGTRAGKETTADLLRTVLYFGYKFNDRIVFNSEIEYEHATSGEGAEEKGEVSAEFANLDFLLHKSVNVRAGLLLVPVGLINEMHEPPTFLGARRPDVETRVLPSTWREIGVGFFGDVGPFSYRTYAVSGLDARGFDAGSGLRGGRQDGSEAAARDVGFVARADFHGVPGMLVGASFYTGDSGQGAEDSSGDVIDGRVTLYDLHGEYSFRGLQVRALWSSVSVDDAGEISREILGLDPADPNAPGMAADAVGSRLKGWYGQVGYDILTAASDRTEQAVIPFVRYERYDTQDRVPSGFVTTGANDVRVITYGAAYKPIPNLAVKLDFQDINRGDRSGTDQINVALSYLF